MRRVLALLLSVVFAASACGDTELPELEAGPADTLPAPELTDAPTSTPSVPEREVVADDGGARATTSTAPSGSGTTPSVPPTATESADLRPPAGTVADVAALVQQAASTESTSMRLVVDMEMAGFPGGPDQPVVFGMESAFTADGRRGWVALDFGDLLALTDEGLDPALSGFLEGMEMRFVDETVYVSAAAFGGFLEVDTAWISMPAEGDDAGMEMQQTAVTADEFILLMNAFGADAEIVGREVVDGVDTTRVGGTVAVEDLVALGGQDPFAGFDPTGSTSMVVDEFRVDVWIGDDGYVRRMELLVAGTDGGQVGELRMTVSFLDLGAPVVVEAPAPADVTPIEDVMETMFGGAFAGS